MQVRADEIAAVLERQLAGYEAEVDVAEVGTVLSVGDGIARVYGLEQAMAGELLAFPNDVYALALNLEEDQVGAVLMGESRLVEEGDEVRRTGRVMEVPVGPALVGRVVGPLGNPIDGKGPIESVRIAVPDRAHRSGRGRPPAGVGADADRNQGDRLDDPGRPRSA